MNICIIDAYMYLNLCVACIKNDFHMLNVNISLHKQIYWFLRNYSANHTVLGIFVHKTPQNTSWHEWSSSILCETSTTHVQSVKTNFNHYCPQQSLCKKVMIKYNAITRNIPDNWWLHLSIFSTFKDLGSY